VKFAWIDTQCRQYPLSALCEVLDVSVNGYRAGKRGGTLERQRLSDAQLLTLIRTIHAQYKGAYGSPSITEEVRSRSFPASKARMERLMSDNGIRARHKRRYRVTTIRACSKGLYRGQLLSKRCLTLYTTRAWLL
jgi:putative transposase